jgi:hypothetical protein
MANAAPSFTRSLPRLPRWAAAIAPDRSPATTADLAHAVARIDHSIDDRRVTDTPLINYWRYLLLLTWATAGVYPLLLLGRRVRRVDRFSRRKAPYYEALIDWTDLYAQQCGRSDANLHDLLGEARARVRAAYAGPLRPIGARRAVLLTVGTFGLFGFFVLHRLNRYWWDAQVVEQEFDERLSLAWCRLGLIEYPLTFHPDSRGRRSFRRHLTAAALTLGGWAVVWDYRIRRDPDGLYTRFHSVEDAVRQVVRSP